MLRPPTRGDFLAIERHGVLYAEYGFDPNFEGPVAQVSPIYMQREDPRERAWIADVAGEPVGDLLHAQERQTAQLRLLPVEPDAEGSAPGFVEQCVQFAEQVRLHGDDAMDPDDPRGGAQRLYERAGNHHLGSSSRTARAEDLVDQTWTRDSQSPVSYLNEIASRTRKSLTRRSRSSRPRGQPRRRAGRAPSSPPSRRRCAQRPPTTRC